MVTRENYEEYMMMHADGELSPSQEQELMSFLYDHPEYQHELTAFSMSKLIPDDNLVYTRKVSLMKPESGAIAIPFAPWKRYAIAAGVAALVMLGGYNIWNYTANDTTALAANNDIDTTKRIAESEVALNNARETTTPATFIPDEVKKSVAVAPEAKQKANASGIAKVETSKPAESKKNIPAQDAYANAAAVAANETTITTVKPTAIVAYKNIPEISEAVVTNVPPATIYMQEGDKETKVSIVDKLPIDELKKEGMENVVTAMANGYDKINAIKQGISETVVSFKIERRKLIVSF